MPVQNYETLNNNTDVTSTKTLLHEVIPLTGTIVSGTYGAETSEENIKNYSHGMFQSVYDYPYLSSSANHIFDITMGYDEGSAFSGSGNTQNSKKINIYNQFSQVLLGYTGSENTVEIFESDLNFADNDRQMKSCYFINFSRLLTKDQIKKGSFSITLSTGSWTQDIKAGAFPNGPMITLADASASATGGTNNKGVAGEYGVLYRYNGTTENTYGSGSSGGDGLIFYQAGIAVITSSLWDNFLNHPNAIVPTNNFYNRHADQFAQSVSASFTGSMISASCDALRHRIGNISYNNTTEINSTIYFCRTPYNKYNYSSNPTYTSGSKIRVKSVATDTPISYITTVGLYNSNNELLATAKLSEPLRKDNTSEITLRVRLDY